MVTVGRSDYGIYLPVLRGIQKDPDLTLHLIVSGMHLSPEFGMTVQTIEEGGFPIADRVEMLDSSDSPEGIAKSMGMGTMGFAQSYARFQPDILLVLGDRFEMHAAVVAALPFKLPVAHIHGGEITEGAIDDALRHSITKMSHLHFVATEEYRDRVIQMGEAPWRVTVSGAPSLDNLESIELMDSSQLEARFRLKIDSPPLLVTFHPVTLEYEQTAWQTGELLAALEDTGMPVVFTLPNADTNGRIVARLIREFVDNHSCAQLVDNLGTQGFFSLMPKAAAMVGNSSSGIIEAPSFGLPVVNIGTRQRGRVRASNVIDVDYSRKQILQGVKQALDAEFRERLSDMNNPYGCGNASEKIVERLKEIRIDEDLVVKRFHRVAPV